MTKLRPAETIEAALMAALDHLSPRQIRDATGLSRDHLLHVSDPDDRRVLPARAAAQLDAVLMAGGEEPRLLPTLEHERDLVLRRLGGDRRPILPPSDRLHALVAETGDVSRALITASADGVLCRQDLRRLLVEAEQVIEAATAMARDLRVMIAAGEGGA